MEENKTARERFLSRRMPGCVVTGIYLLAAAAVFAVAASAGLLPARYLAAGGASLLLFGLAAALLTRDFSRRGRFAAGAALASLLTTALIVLGVYFHAAVRSLRQFSGASGQTAEVAVFVPAESAAKDLSDLAEGTFGVLETMDRPNTDRTVEALAKDLGGDAPALREYGSVPALVDALLREKEVDAILLNTAYLSLLEETEGYAGAGRLLRQIDRRRVAREPSGPERTPTPAALEEPRAFTLYISGSDSRSGLDAVSRSDVNILAAVHTGTRQILLVTTPRDYFVPLSVSGGVPDKLTHAGIYGVTVSMETLEMLYGIRIDDYIRVNFSGFETIVDALGGITVENDEAFSSGGYTFPEGKNTLDGAAALVFARERYAFLLGDVQRGLNQTRLLSAMIQKALSPEILTRYASILQSLEGSFETSLSYEEIAALVRGQLERGGGWDVFRYTVTGAGDEAVPYSMGVPVYVMRPDTDTVEHAAALMEKVLAGEKISEADVNGAE